MYIIKVSLKTLIFACIMYTNICKKILLEWIKITPHMCKTYFDIEIQMSVLEFQLIAKVEK